MFVSAVRSSSAPPNAGPLSLRSTASWVLGSFRFVRGCVVDSTGRSRFLRITFDEPTTIRAACLWLCSILRSPGSTLSPRSRLGGLSRLGLSVPGDGRRYGFDTIGVSYPCRPVDDFTGMRLSVSGAGTPEQQVRGTFPLDSGGFAAVGVGGRCWIEVSAPKALYGTNVEPASARAVIAALSECYAEASLRVPPVEHFTDSLDLRLTRVDVTREFDVPTSAQAALLDNLGSFARGRRWTVRRFADADRGKAQTLRIGTRSSWSATLYDKGAEQGLPLEQLRFEARLRRAFLRSEGARAAFDAATSDVWEHLGDLTDDAARELARNRFQAVRYGDTVTGVNRLRQLLEDSGLSVGEQRSLVAYLVCDAIGLDHGMSDNTERKYRRLATQLGIVAVFDLGELVTQRLDFDLGTLVLEVGEHDSDQQIPPAG